MLFTASSRNWYSTPCRSPWPEPRSRISMKIPQATEKPVRNVRSLFFRIVSKISCQVSTSNTGDPRLVALDEPVPKMDDTIGPCRDVVFVGDDHDRDSRLVDVVEDVHHLEGRRRVEGARRLVGEDDLRLGDERARDRHALLLPARHFGGTVGGPGEEADPLEILSRQGVSLPPRD